MDGNNDLSDITAQNYEEALPRHATDASEYRRPLDQLPLHAIDERCAEETRRFYRNEPHDPRYGYELFRRALVLEDQLAWSYLYRHYDQQVYRWIHRYPTFTEYDEETATVVNRAFEKMWSAIPPQKFCKFPDLQHLLSYLHICAHSALVEMLRASNRRSKGHLVVSLDATNAIESDIEEDQPSIKHLRVNFWQTVLERCNNEKEHVVLQGSFLLALTPHELYVDHPHMFASVNEIYRVKQNVLDRLGRDVEISQLDTPQAISSSV